MLESHIALNVGHHNKKERGVAEVKIR